MDHLSKIPQTESCQGASINSWKTQVAKFQSRDWKKLPPKPALCLPATQFQVFCFRICLSSVESFQAQILGPTVKHRWPLFWKTKFQDWYKVIINNYNIYICIKSCWLTAHLAWFCTFKKLAHLRGSHSNRDQAFSVCVTEIRGSNKTSLNGRNSCHMFSCVFISVQMFSYVLICFNVL